MVKHGSDGVMLWGYLTAAGAGELVPADEMMVDLPVGKQNNDTATAPMIYQIIYCN